MVAISVDKRQLKKTFGVILAVIILAVVVIVVGGNIFKSSGEEAPIRGETAAQREEYLDALGLKFSRSSTVSEVNVPEEFDERFTSYNEMLKQAGFDLEPLKGESVIKCTYDVSNRADLGEKVFAVLLVHDGVIVAGHLITPHDGAFYPLTQPIEETGASILP